MHLQYLDHISQHFLPKSLSQGVLSDIDFGRRDHFFSSLEYVDPLTLAARAEALRWNYHKLISSNSDITKILIQSHCLSV